MNCFAMMSQLHRVTLETRRVGERGVVFTGRCSCGATSGPLPNSGMVSGWEARHVEEALEESRD